MDGDGLRGDRDGSAVGQAGEYHWAQPVKGSTIPTKIDKGQKVTFKIHTIASSGEGMVRWAPDGKHVVALWDYIAELD